MGGWEGAALGLGAAGLPAVEAQGSIISTWYGATGTISSLLLVQMRDLGGRRSSSTTTSRSRGRTKEAASSGQLLIPVVTQPAAIKFKDIAGLGARKGSGRQEESTGGFAWSSRQAGGQAGKRSNIVTTPAAPPYS
jgi:hypothetical protein